MEKLICLILCFKISFIYGQQQTQQGLLNDQLETFLIRNNNNNNRLPHSYFKTYRNDIANQLRPQVKVFETNHFDQKSFNSKPFDQKLFDEYKNQKLFQQNTISTNFDTPNFNSNKKNQDSKSNNKITEVIFKDNFDLNKFDGVNTDKINNGVISTSVNNERIKENDGNKDSTDGNEEFIPPTYIENNDEPFKTNPALDTNDDEFQFVPKTIQIDNLKPPKVNNDDEVIEKFEYIPVSYLENRDPPFNVTLLTLPKDDELLNQQQQEDIPIIFNKQSEFKPTRLMIFGPELIYLEDKKGEDDLGDEYYEEEDDSEDE